MRNITIAITKNGKVTTLKVTDAIARQIIRLAASENLPTRKA